MAEEMRVNGNDEHDMTLSLEGEDGRRPTREGRGCAVLGEERRKMDATCGKDNGTGNGSAKENMEARESSGT